MTNQTNDKKRLAKELCELLRNGTLEDIRAKTEEIRARGWQFECSLDNYSVLSNNEDFIYNFRDLHYPSAVVVGEFPW